MIQPENRRQLVRVEDDQLVISRRLAFSVIGTLVLGLSLAIVCSLTDLPGWIRSRVSVMSGQLSSDRALAEVNPPEGYALRVQYGDIGPQLLAAGAIDRERFIQLYANSGTPLTDEQIQILTEGSDTSITINRQNAHFLLNLLWALGLTNQNEILEQGQLMQASNGEIERFASTGGWTLGVKSARDLYASTSILSLSAEQQALVAEAADNTYRPCCNNSTAFADCNHGMAMLGLYELMASQGATLDEMYQAAKYFNAFWFPQHAMQLAIYFRSTTGEGFAEVDPRTVVSAQYSSGNGAQVVQGWLAQNDLLPQSPGGGSCGV